MAVLIVSFPLSNSGHIQVQSSNISHVGLFLFSFNSSEEESRRHPPPPNCPSFASRNARRVLLHSNPTPEGLKEIMGETQLDDLSNAFLLSCHLFEAVRNEMKDDAGRFSMMSYQQVRQVLSEIGEVIGKASMGPRVSNLQIQLSIMQESDLQDMWEALEDWSRNLDVERASDDDINMWKRIETTVRDCLYEGLKEVISNRMEPDCALVENMLRLIDRNRVVLWPPIQKEGPQQPQQPEPDVHQNLICVGGVDASDFPWAQRQRLINEIWECCLNIGFDPAGRLHFLKGSVWIVIGTLKPLSDEQQSHLLKNLDAYVQDCKNSLKKDPSNRCWLFAKSPKLVHGAFVPMGILKRIRLIRDLARRSAPGVATDHKWPERTWLDTNALKQMAMNLHNSSSPTPIVLEQIRLLQQGSELQEDQLLLSTNGLQIIVEQNWEDLTWPEGFLEIMRKISQTQKSEELPWSKSKSFQDFALAVHGICSSNEQICAACLEILRAAHGSDKMVIDYECPHELLTKAQLRRL